MPQPQLLDDIESPLVRAYRSAQQRVDAEQQALADNPKERVRLRRLEEMQRRISTVMDEVDDEAAGWVSQQFPRTYAAGATSTSEMAWTMIHQEAVEEMAFQLFQDLLEATRGVRETTKELVRSVARDEALQSLIGGNTAQQAGRLMQAKLADHGIYAVRYVDGSRHSLREYAEMAMRTKTAEAFNVGTLNANQEVQYFEIFDGPDCGLSYHDDPTLAMGMIVDRLTADTYRIAHPNCRRSFGPRPDITSQAQIDELADNPLTVGSGQTTIGQRAAQVEQDRVRTSLQKRRADRQRRMQRSRRSGAQRMESRLASRADAMPAPSGEVPTPSTLGPDDLVFDEATGKVKVTKTYNTRAEVPSVGQLIDAGFDPEDAVLEHKRLNKNAGNVERRARNRAKAEAAKNPTKTDAVLADQAGLPGDQPKALYDKTADAGGPGSQGLWYERIARDTAEGEYIPVHDLTVDGHRIREGVAVRRNGRTYVLEYADGVPHSPSQALKELNRIQETTEAALGPVGPLAAKQRGVAVTRYANPADKHWAKQYGMPGFKSTATADGKGGMVFWNKEPRPGVILHEFGHTIDNGVSGSAGWAQAQMTDFHSSVFHKNNAFQSSIHGHTITPGGAKGVTDYGKVAVKEDWAESVRLFMADHHNGYVGWTNVDGDMVSVRFADVFPARARILSERTGIPVNYDTPFAKAAEARAKKLVAEMYHESAPMVKEAIAKRSGMALTRIDDAWIKRVVKEVEASDAKAAAKRAAEAALRQKDDLLQKLARQELTTDGLSFADKTGVGVRKSNARKKAKAAGLSDDLAEKAAKAAEQEAIASKLGLPADDIRRAMSGELALKPKATKVSAGVRGSMSPSFSSGARKRADSWVTGTREKHPWAKSFPGNKAAQTKANLVAEISERTFNKQNFEALMKVPSNIGVGWSSGIKREWTDPLHLRKEAYQQAVSNVIQGWAATSGDHSPGSLAVQRAIAEEFGLTNTAYRHLKNAEHTIQAADKIYEKGGTWLRTIVRGMYDHTQEELAKAGIKEVSVYRGMVVPKSSGFANGVRSLDLQPANSWATRDGTSLMFGDTMLTATVPASQILGTARTGFGCLHEFEFVVLNSPGQVRVTRNYRPGRIK